MKASSGVPKATQAIAQPGSTVACVMGRSLATCPQAQPGSGLAPQCPWGETCHDPGVDAAVWISVVAASVTVASLPFTVRAANSARLSVREARRQTELQERVHRDSAQPYVWADLQGDDAQGHLLRLIVTNEGPSIATAVHVTFEPPLQTAGDSTQLDQVQERLRIGLSSLAPGRRLQWTVDMAH